MLCVAFHLRSNEGSQPPLEHGRWECWAAWWGEGVSRLPPLAGRCQSRAGLWDGCLRCAAWEKLPTVGVQWNKVLLEARRRELLCLKENKSSFNPIKALSVLWED